MDHVKSICLVLTLIFSSILHSQDDAVEWTPDARLSWEQFQAQPEQNSKIAAVTASGISYEFSSMERDGYYEVEYSVRAYFYPRKSWYQPQMCDDLILSHEQLHFDISELFTRKMRGRMEKARFTKDVKAEVKAIYHSIISELRAFQSRYDRETDFSRNREAQLEWNIAINAALDSE